MQFFQSKRISLIVIVTIVVVSFLLTATISFAAESCNKLDLELEDFSGQSLFSPFEVIDDEDASGGHAIIWPEDGNNQYNPTSTDESTGQVIISFYLTETADVTFQIRENLPHMGSDSFYYKLDDGSWGVQNSVTTVVDEVAIYNTLTPAIFTEVSAGEHTLRMVAREDGAIFDKVTLTASVGCISDGPPAVETDEPVVTDEPAATDEQPAATDEPANSVDEDDDLPKTGEESPLAYYLIGAILICISGGVLYYKKRLCKE